MTLFSQVLPFPLRPSLSLSLSPSLRTVSVSVAALFLCLFALAQPSRAQIIITTDTTISTLIDDNVLVEGSPTVNIVLGADITGEVYAYDTSIINVSAGTVQRTLGATDASTVNVSGGTIGENLGAGGTATVNLSGGTVQRNVTAYSGGTVNVSGGTITWFLGAENRGTINLSGGTIGEGLYLLGTDTRLNVVGTGLSLSVPMLDAEIGVMYVVLSGTLADGTPINNRVYLDEGAQVSQITLKLPGAVDSYPELRAQVQALGTSGVLSKGYTNALLAKLDTAQSAAAAGNLRAERDALTGFINQVNGFVRAGKLTQGQAAPLLETAQAILSSLG